jgi:hypothetical protein
MKLQIFNRASFYIFLQRFYNEFTTKIYSLSPILDEYFVSVIDIDIVNIKLDPAFREIIAQTEYSGYEKERQLLLLEAAEIEAQRCHL